MAITVRLTVLTGPHKNRKFCFCGPTRCQVGRALDCFVQLSGTERDRLISRHHCQLEINPPVVQIGDLGSSNGTYVKRKKVDPIPKELAVLPISETVGSVVKDGDLITIGGTTFKAEVVDCPHALNEAVGKPTWEDGQCVEGRVEFTGFGKTQTLDAGHLLYLPTGEPHSVKGVENAVLLVTVLLPKP